MVVILFEKQNITCLNWKCFLNYYGNTNWFSPRVSARYSCLFTLHKQAWTYHFREGRSKILFGTSFEVLSKRISKDMLNLPKETESKCKEERISDF